MTKCLSVGAGFRSVEGRGRGETGVWEISPSLESLMVLGPRGARFLRNTSSLILPPGCFFSEGFILVALLCNKRPPS